MTSPLSAGLRREVAGRARFRCSYCQSQEDVVGASFTVDHIIPQVLGGSDEPDNLCLACWDCNRLKRTHVAGVDPDTGQRAPLFDPNHQRWADHFAWSEDGRLVLGLTPIGRATVERLRLNQAVLVRAREHWIRAGWHPPDAL